jgi:S-adenosyl-L-methionine hydrolase (adenosine-forming)
MENRPIITLTSDFGYKDPFVGIMKGVITAINPSAVVLDITHEINPQNIIEAAFTIGTSFAFFPHNTIHVVIVDPGVGSPRRPILVAADYNYFVGPDNGIFSRIYSLSESFTVINITAEHYFLPGKSSTFHGRDVFAPVAGWLSKGINITKFGDPVTDYVTIQMPEPIASSGNMIEGEVIYIDHFGNVITNVPAEKIDVPAGVNQLKKPKIVVKGIEAPLKNFYSEAEDKGIYSLINSFGYLEFFVNKGNASLSFNIGVGEKVDIILS